MTIRPSILAMMFAAVCGALCYLVAQTPGQDVVHSALKTYSLEVVDKQGRTIAKLGSAGRIDSGYAGLTLFNARGEAVIRVGLDSVSHLHETVPTIAMLDGKGRDKITLSVSNDNTASLIIFQDKHVDGLSVTVLPDGNTCLNVRSARTGRRLLAGDVSWLGNYDPTAAVKPPYFGYTLMRDDKHVLAVHEKGNKIVWGAPNEEKQ